MKRYAIDVVLLPPEPVMDLAIEWNRALNKTDPASIVLTNTRYYPHISLAMGCLSTDRLDQAIDSINSIAAHHQLLQLHVPRIHTAAVTSGHSVVSFDIELNPALATLHQSVVTALSPLVTMDATEEDIDDPPPIDPAALDWINHYISDYSFQHFWPHITLGFGKPSGNFQPFSFHASRLAVCYLGNHCTCASILSEVSLKRL